MDLTTAQTPRAEAPRRHFDKVVPWEWIALGLTLAGYLAICVVTIRLGSPLGHDEALYATRARDFLNAEPPSSWYSGNRAPGLPLLLTIAWLGNATEPYLRLVVALCGAGLIVFTWLTGRLMLGRLAAMIAAVGLALTPVVVVAATQVWPDVPGAAAGMAALFFYAWGLSAERFRWWVVAAVITFIAAATVIRFGAPIPIGIGLIGLTLWRWPRDTEKRIRVGVVALVGGAIVFWFLMTPVITGAQIPGQTISVASADNPALQGYFDYWNQKGRIFSGAAAIGLFGIVVGLVGSLWDRRLGRALVWPLLIALATVAAISTVVHGEPRYLSPAFPWFWLAAGTGLAAAARRIRRPAAFVVAGLILAVVVPVTPQLTDDAQLFNMGFTTIETAARSLDTDTPCGVFTSYTPQVEWYSECETQVIDRRKLVVESPSLPAGPTYLFFVQDGKRQPEGELLEDYLDRTTGSPERFGPPGQRLRYVEIWDLKD